MKGAGNTLFLNKNFRIGDDVKYIAVQADYYYMGNLFQADAQFCMFNNRDEVRNLYVLLGDYLGVGQKNADAAPSFGSDLMEAIAELQEDGNAPIRDLCRKLNEVSALVCEYRSELALPDNEALKYIGDINNVIYYLKRLEK